MGETEFELRSRGSFSRNPQSGDADDRYDNNNSQQKTGWLRSRASRISSLGKRKACIFALVIIVTASTMALVIPFEGFRIVSRYCAKNFAGLYLFLYIWKVYWWWIKSERRYFFESTIDENNAVFGDNCNMQYYIFENYTRRLDERKGIDITPYF